jgi:hypothetical protein
MMTCGVGLTTLLVLWIPIPLLHFTGVEEFAIPYSWKVVSGIAGIAGCGVVFNSSLMVCDYFSFKGMCAVTDLHVFIA